MTETPARIRWERQPATGSQGVTGYVGRRTEPAFRIFPPDASNDHWLLSVRLGAGWEWGYGDGTDELKEQAERWLTEFAASLGAVFPAEPLTDSQRWQVGQARETLALWGGERRKRYPDGDVLDRERVLADQLRFLLATVDQLAPEPPKEAGQ